MLGFRDENEGIPARLYRSPDEIRRDIAEISKRSGRRTSSSRCETC